MKSLNISLDCRQAINPLEMAYGYLSEVRRRALWVDAYPFLSAITSLATEQLGSAIVDPNFPHIKSSSPFIATSYVVQKPFSESTCMRKFDEEFNLNPSNRPEEILHALHRQKMEIVDSELDFELPQDYLLNEQSFSEESQTELLAKDVLVSIVRFKGQLDEKTELTGAVYVIYHCAITIRSTGEIRFPIFAGLHTKDNIHEKFSTLRTNQFWRELIQQIHQELPYKNAIELSTNDLSKPQLATIKSPVHLERLKYGKKPSPTEPKSQFIESMELTETDIIGLDLDKKHQHALNAVQKLLHNTRYTGNTKCIELDGRNGFHFHGVLPRVQVTKAEYLQAYGARKFQTSRGKWEFSGKESEEAIGALRDLARKSYLLVGKRIYYENNEERIDRYETYAPLIKLSEGWEGLTKKEDSELDRNLEGASTRKKHKGFIIEPCPILVDQVNNHFVLKPADMYDEIRLKAPKASKYTYTFIDWLLNTATLKRRKSGKGEWPEALEVSHETLAYSLRLSIYIKTRRWKRIDEIIEKCVQNAIMLNWLKSHEAVPGKTVDKLDRFVLNQKKFDSITPHQDLSAPLIEGVTDSPS